MLILVRFLVGLQARRCRVHEVPSICHAYIAEQNSPLKRLKHESVPINHIKPTAQEAEMGD